MKGNFLKILFLMMEKNLFLSIDFDIKYPELRMSTEKDSMKKKGTRNANVIENGHIVRTYISNKNNKIKMGIIIIKMKQIKYGVII